MMSCMPAVRQEEALQKDQNQNLSKGEQRVPRDRLVEAKGERSW